MSVFKKTILAAALAFAAVSAQAAAILTFSSPTVTNGSSVDVDFTVSGIDDLNGYGLTVNFDAALLSVASITSGSFLGTAGTPDFGFNLGSAPGVIDYIYDGLYGTGPGAAGSGTLFTIHFDTLGVGTALISFTDLIVFDTNLVDIPFTATGGAVSILPAVVTPPGGDVPEPASLMLLGIGAAGLLARRRGAPALKLAA